MVVLNLAAVVGESPSATAPFQLVNLEVTECSRLDVISCIDLIAKSHTNCDTKCGSLSPSLDPIVLIAHFRRKVTARAVDCARSMVGSAVSRFRETFHVSILFWYSFKCGSTPLHLK